MERFSTLSLALLATLLLTTAPSLAQPDISQSFPLEEPNGFGATCAAPCFIVQKTAEVYFDGNPSAPGVCGPGENTFTYTLEHIGGTFPGDGIPISEFELSVDAAIVASAGSINGAGIDAVTSQFPGFINWTFPDPSNCPACLDLGKTSDVLYICSTASPGTEPDIVSTTALVLDANGTCIVPVQAMVVGEPMPCTIGFWKNRAKGKKGLLKFFPGTDFDAVVAEALNLSMGVFTSADLSLSGCPNFDDLLCALTSKGNRTTAERARQQLAATLLNLAAGDLFLDNGKCQLFEENGITSNACGDNTSVGAAVSTSKAGITSGDSQAEHDALECLDDINNEIGVVQ